MIRYQGIAFTAYAVTNMKKARKFYEGALGLKVARTLGDNFYEYDIGAGTLVVACAPEQWQPSKTGTAAALEVADIEAAAKHLTKKRIKLAIPLREFPPCRMLGVRDPDGNLICLHQRKKAGKKS